MRADLHRIARLALVVIVVHRRLEEERVAALGAAHAVDSLLSRRHEHTRPSVSHEAPHSFVRRDLGAL